ncbi:MAG: ABC transporter permease [Bdellovibrionaceae bacterium]|nr:ABC transporter permease [Pseudobdellovibrionaceae bacterium]MBX3032289.1 ABC transporter permease [Pseudobdellovibrionaceae bacterium]
MTWSKWLAASWMFFLLGASLVVSLFFPELGSRQDIERIYVAPSPQHWFGTDSLGRDLFARVLLGTKVSLSVGLAASMIAMLVGVLYGLAAGWWSGWIDRALMRLNDLLIALPSFAWVAVLTMTLQAALPWTDDGFGKIFWSLSLGIGLTHWMTVARVTRGLVLRTKVMPFIEASQALGAGNLRVLFHHVLPNIAAPLWVLFGLLIPGNILYESFMSFIGVGVQAPDTSWGLLVQEGWQSLSTAPHLILCPSFVLFLTIWSLHVWLEEARRRGRAHSDEGGDQPPKADSRTSAAAMVRSS